MRSLIVLTTFLASLAGAAWNEHTSVRELMLDADGVDTLEIDAGAGRMDIRGVDDLDRIVVTATVVVPESDEDDAMKLIDRKMRLALDKAGKRARLVADFEQGFFGMGSGARIDLGIEVPTGMAVDIDDGAGSIDIVGVDGNVSIDDGSGSIDVQGAADVSIDDGSGSIDVSASTGDVSIVDGSGSIEVRSVAGSVTIDDGSGGIKVSDVEQDLIIVDDGSGGLNYTNVRGEVREDS